VAGKAGRQKRSAKKTGGVVNEKYPGGVDAQKKLLEQEGHKVVQKGKKYVVADFEKYL